MLQAEEEEEEDPFELSVGTIRFDSHGRGRGGSLFLPARAAPQLACALSPSGCSRLAACGG